MDFSWALALVPFICAGAGAYLGGYLKKKGENLATHEDINNLKEQVEVVTTTTKGIEAKISNEVWDRQKRWELKREVLFEGLKWLVELDDAVVRLRGLLKTKAQVEKPDDNPHWLQILHEGQQKWLCATSGFDHAITLIATVCEVETRKAFDNFRLAAGKVTSLIIEGGKNPDEESLQDIALRLFAARAAVRKELGIEPTASPSAPLPERR